MTSKFTKFASSCVQLTVIFPWGALIIVKNWSKLLNQMDFSPKQLCVRVLNNNVNETATTKIKCYVNIVFYVYFSDVKHIQQNFK